MSQNELICAKSLIKSFEMSIFEPAEGDFTNKKGEVPFLLVLLSAMVWAIEAIIEFTFSVRTHIFI
ncbi:MAG TPA: hypothetical protein DDX39_12160 [Bacteroidales bacterium]|nr:MAG: hypothetical protein A2W98_11565 [Bacteroidetes bacterium GWF2_33_38]OFY68990.1 MAG: hypothetical protein A2265_06060 [Bacteroidetes bacterium RIFOXYA12_FULL_33_9]HBF89386.1 hypothetical protein [Bacteroidales bacterium]